MLSLEESIAQSLDCGSLELLPFLPYILQDFDEIGSSADFLLSVVKKHAPNPGRLKVIDLGCGKGAVTIRIAECLSATCVGVDGMADFIAHARSVAQGKGLADCTFVCADIRQAVGGLGVFDVVILGSIGPVFGDWLETLTILQDHVRHDGIVIVDEGYVADDDPFHHDLVRKKADVFRQIEQAGMRVVQEYVDQDEGCVEQYDRQMADISRRCRELQDRHPQMKELFESFISKQREEYAGLQNHIVRTTLILGRAA